jgi:hypothetical protein
MMSSPRSPSLPKGVNFLPKIDPPVLASCCCHFYAMLALNSVAVMPSVLATWSVTPVVDMIFSSLHHLYLIVLGKMAS